MNKFIRIIVLNLLVALIIPLGACKKESPKEAVNPSATTPVETVPDNPVEAKKMRMAEIIKELVDIEAQKEKLPELRVDEKLAQREQSLLKEGETLSAELTGGDLSKENALVEEVVKKYAPEYYEKLSAERAKAMIISAESRLRGIQYALEKYKCCYAKYPATDEGLLFLTLEHDDKGSFMDKNMLKDPWGNEIIYELVDEHQYNLKSLGPDGKDNTSDDIALEE
ncbi:MAG: type II secretion system protein GspG [Planctomycetes bacterium]|nr:type II secretion system protein GspG [Planctomycetota bacterium]